MKKLAILLSAIGLAAAAPLAGADTAQLELMPSARAKVEGVDITHYVRDEGSSAAKSDDAFYARGTGGISPQ